MMQRQDLMQANAGEHLVIEVRLIGEPCLWGWELVDEKGRKVVESSWETEWTGYASSGEAWIGGLARLQRVSRPARGVASADRPLSPKARHLIIVARHAVERYKSLKATFGESRTTEMILDRRYSERRQRNNTPSVERRQAERRGRPDVDAQIRGCGWSIVRPVGTDDTARPEDPVAPLEAPTDS